MQNPKAVPPDHDASQPNAEAPKTNFYAIGGTLQRDAPSYVARRADNELYENLLAGQFCYVLTSRQMGKSSLMVRSAVRLREIGAAVAILDITAIGRNLNPEQWYEGLLARIGQQLKIEDELDDFWVEHERLGPLQRWMRALREVLLEEYKGQVVIFIDEIDAVRSLPFSTDEFFAGLREFFNRRTEDPELKRLTFCLLGVATPTDLINDVRTTPFNIGHRIDLTDFSEPEALVLAKGFKGREQVDLELLKRILYWTGGHPYLTQRLCQAVAEDLSAQSRAEVDRLCDELFLSPRARERDDNLLFVRDRVLHSNVDVPGLLQLYEQVRKRKRIKADETSPLIGVLRLSGITRVLNGLLAVRNQIYHHVFDNKWIKANMPGAELRRQRAAFFKGLRRAAIAGVVVIAIVASILAFMAMRSARLASSRLVESYETQGREELLREDTEHALHHFIMAYDEGKGSNSTPAQEKELRFLLARVFSALKTTGQTASLEGHTGAVTQVASSPDGNYFLTVSDDKTVKIWDARSNALLNTLAGHEKAVNIASFSPDSKYIVTASDDKTAKIWDVQTGQLLHTLAGHQGWVYHATFSPDGKMVATSNEDYTAKIWDVATGQLLHTLDKRHTRQMHYVAFSPNGKSIVTASDDLTAVVWDTATGTPRVTLKGDEFQPRMAIFSPDGKTILTVSNKEQTVKIWDAGDGKLLRTLQGHTRVVNYALFSPDGSLIVTGSADDTAKIWDAATGSLLQTLEGHPQAVSQFAFNSDGTRIVTASGRTAKLWNVKDGKLLASLEDFAGEIKSAVFSLDGMHVITASTDGTAKVWDWIVAARARQMSLGGHTDEVNYVSHSPDGKLVVTASRDMTAKIWNAQTGEFLRTLIDKELPVTEGQPPRSHDAALRSTAFSPDSRLILTTGEDESGRLWDATSGQLLFRLKTPHVEGSSCASCKIYYGVFSPNGKLVVTTSEDHSAMLWNVATGELQARLIGHKQHIKHAAFSPDSTRLITASDDHTAILWDVASGQLLHSLEGHQDRVKAVAYSPDGSRVLTASKDRTAKVWDVSSGKLLYTLEGHEDDVNYGAFSPDSKSIVTASLDGTARLWDAANGNLLRILEGHLGGLWTAKWSSDGEFIVTASDDSTVKVWGAATGHLLSSINHRGVVYYAEFSADDQHIVTASADGTSIIWNAGIETGNLDETIAKAKQRYFPNTGSQSKRQQRSSRMERERGEDSSYRYIFSAHQG